MHTAQGIHINASPPSNNIETFISTTQDTTFISKSTQNLILNNYIAAISPSYGPDTTITHTRHNRHREY